MKEDSMPVGGWHRRRRRLEGWQLAGVDGLARLWALRAFAIAPKGLDDVSRDLGLLLFGRPQPGSDEEMARRLAETRLSTPAPPEPTELGRFVDEVGEVACLTSAERLVLLFTLVASGSALGEALVGQLGPESALFAYVARILDVDTAEIAAALHPDGALRAAGLVDVELADHGDVGRHLVASHLLLRLASTGIGGGELADHLLPPASPATCSLEDFGHLRDDVELLREALQTLFDRRAGGRLLVLLHGAPGVGKSELPRALAEAVGARVHEVRFEDHLGDAMDARDRLGALRLAQRLVPIGSRTLILMDELEDLFPARLEIFGPQRESPGTKAYLNRVLERARTPIFFTANKISHVDPSFLRRMDFTLEMGIPPAPARRRIIAKHVGGLPVSNRWMDEVAAEARVAPAAFERAARVVRQLGRTETPRVEEALDRVLARGVGSSVWRRPPSAAGTLRYDLDLVRTSVPMAPVIDALRRERRGTLLLHGAPGTGKTAAAAEIARRLDRPLALQTASELLSPWLGGTEQNLRRVFSEAESTGAVITFDEADTFLRPRASARHRWESSTTNELLLLLERNTGIVVLTTNLEIAELDPAALRRCDVKIRFEPADADQRWRLLVASLGALELPMPSVRDELGLRAQLAQLDRLGPGHFSTALRSARFRDGIRDGFDLVARLIEEHGVSGSAARAAGTA